MENNFYKYIDYEKEEILETEKVIVASDALLKMAEEINNSNYNKVLILFSKGKHVVDFIKNSLTKRTINIIEKEFCIPTIFSADAIEDCGQDLVVAIGEDSLINVAKYFSACFNCDLYIYPIGDFVDYTFSSFARLFDGVCFDFYKTATPKMIFVDLSINKYNPKHTHYISSKCLAIFDNEVRENVFKHLGCSKVKRFIKKVLFEYMSTNLTIESELNLKNIWTLVRLGLAMSFFNQTRMFFSSDLGVNNLLQARRLRSSFLDLETVSLKLIISAYSCFYNNYVSCGAFSLSKHVLNLAKFLKISQLEVLKRLGFIYKQEEADKLIKRLNAYYPYLQIMFSKQKKRVEGLVQELEFVDNSTKKYGLNQSLIKKSLALSSCLNKTPSTIHLMLFCGYLDKLL